MLLLPNNEKKIMNFSLIGLWPEKHSEESLWCPECADGHEHYFQGKEGDQMDRTSHKLSSGVPKLRGKGSPAIYLEMHKLNDCLK